MCPDIHTHTHVHTKQPEKDEMGLHCLSFLQTDFQDQFSLLQHNLDEERERRERLEEQINDLMELHQNEVPNIRQVSVCVCVCVCVCVYVCVCMCVCVIA